MKFSDILKAGNKIRIQSDGATNKRYDPADFWYESGQYIASSPSLGTFHHTAMTDARFNRHIKQMIEEKFQVIITPNN